MENRIPLRTYFDSLLQRVELQIQDYEDNAGDPLTLCRQCVDYLQEALGELKAFVVAYRFASPEEEIHFFKAQKPHLVSKIIYYNTVYQTELRFPSGSVEVQKAYLRSEIERISAFFQKNLSFYQYYRTKATYLDNKYFLRGKPDIQILVDNFHYETDPQFSTSYDFKTAKITERTGQTGTAQGDKERLCREARALDRHEAGVGGTHLCARHSGMPEQRDIGHQGDSRLF